MTDDVNSGPLGEYPPDSWPCGVPCPDRLRQRGNDYSRQKASTAPHVLVGGDTDNPELVGGRYLLRLEARTLDDSRALDGSVFQKDLGRTRRGSRPPSPGSPPT